jgi:hypothetical protein
MFHDDHENENGACGAAAEASKWHLRFLLDVSQSSESIIQLFK